MDRVAKIISHLLNPAMVSLGVFSYLGWQGKDWLVGSVGILSYVLVPGVIWVYLYRKGHIPELYPAARSQREHMLLVGTGLYAFGVVALWLVGASPLVLGAGLAFCSNTLLVWQINKYWKISIHAVGVSGGGAILLLVGGVGMWPVGLALPLVAWARLHLRIHTPAQIIAGSGLGGGASGVLIGWLMRL